MESRQSGRATVLGVLAIVLWSTTVALARSLTEQVGVLTAAASIYLAAGVLGCAAAVVRGRGLARFRGLPLRYWAGCGGLFVFYTVALYLAIGLAAGRQQVVEVGILNYLWPGLTLALSVPLVGNRARPWLGAGILVGFAGGALALLQGGSFAWEELRANLGQNVLPYALGAAAAVAWALYSNLSRRWAGARGGQAVPVFLLAAGLVLGAMRLARPEASAWTARAALELAYMSVFPTLAAYTFWDAAMRRGRMTLVAALSYLTPLLSTLASCVYLGVAAGPGLWLAAAMVVGGAVVCKASIVEGPEVGGGARAGRPPGVPGESRI